MDLDAVADQLYGLPPSDFTSTRQARAAEASQSGDRDLAAAIKKLRRPTTSAWLANLLVRHRRDELLKLLELGAATRQAHSNLDADDLRRLSRQRRQVIGTLSRDARRRAREIGHSVSEAVGRELEATLEAGFADPDACEAVRSGRLTIALSYSGLGPMGVQASSVPSGTSGASSTRNPPRDTSNIELDEVDRQRRKRTETAAVEAVQDAQAAVDRAKTETTVQRDRVADARDLVQLRRREVSDLENQLRERTEALDRATDEIGRAEEAQANAERRARAAADELGRAKGDLEDLRR